VLDELLSSEFIDEVKATLKLDDDAEIDNLDTLMQGFILTSLKNSKLDITKLIDSRDTEINGYLQYC
jgi:hypothetical protein